MKSPLFRAALKDSRVSTMIYCGVLVFYGMMLMSAFASVQSTLSDPFVEFNDAKIIETGNNDEGTSNYNLSWTTQAGVLSHVAIGVPMSEEIMEVIAQMSNGTVPDDLTDLDMTWDEIEALLVENPEIGEMISDQGVIEPKEPLNLDDAGTQLLYVGEGSYVNFRNTAESDIFIVYLVPGDGNLSNGTIRGPVLLSNLDVVSSFDEYLEDNPFIEGFMGGEIMDFTTLKGYVSLEFFSMWPLFLVIFMAIKSGGVVSKHVEDRSMDILLATGYSRTRFLNEKMLLIMLNLLLVYISAFVGLAIGTLAVGEAIPWGSYAMGFMDSVPMALAFIGISLLISVLIDEGAKATGIIMGVVVGEYIVLIISNLAEWGDNLKWFSLFSYSDNYAAMLDIVLDPVNVLIPMGVSVLTIGLSYFIFIKKEIHA